MAHLTDQLDHRRRERLARELTRRLRKHRSITMSADSIDDIDLWRGAARVAGRRLGIPIRTGVSRDGQKVWASEGP